MSCGYQFEVKGELVPCGRCQGCRRKNRRAWVGRMLLEQAEHQESSFVTLTYATEHLPIICYEPEESWIPTLVKSHPQNFVRSVRKKGYEIRYFGSGEYGEKYQRPHYHLIIFGLGPGAIELFRASWGKGHVSAYEANARTMSYVAKYTLKGSKDVEPNSQIFDPSNPERRLTEAPFRIMSLRPPIGAGCATAIGKALKRRPVTYVPESNVHPQRTLRIRGTEYPIDRTIRNRVMDELDLPREFQSQVFHTDYEGPTDAEAEKARYEHQKALRGRHSRTKL